jgi:serine/threonine-protein kinase HipA
VARDFGLKIGEGKAIAADVGKAVLGWRTIANETGISKAQVDRMSSAFEHGDLTHSQRV